MSGFLTGYCNQNEHLRKLGLDTDAIFRFYIEAEETSENLLTQYYAGLAKNQISGRLPDTDGTPIIF